jgi:hypothetical protein
MKTTREVEVWVFRSALEGYLKDRRDSFGVFKSAVNSPDGFRAKLIIEVPMPKIELTEAEFDEAFRSVGFRTVDDDGKANTYAYMDKVKELLFSKAKG